MKIMNKHAIALAMTLIVAVASILPIGPVKEAGARSNNGPGVRPNNDNGEIPESDLIYVTGSSFAMGYDQAYEDGRPVHEVTLNPFYIDRYEVTNARFREFVDAPGYVTTAEHGGYCWAYLEGAEDFQRILGAYWRQPEGPGSSIENRLNHPVVCVSWHDAAAYAAWAGKRLPTEAEWEYAARAGADDHYRADTGEHHGGQDHATVANDHSPSSKSHRNNMEFHAMGAQQSGENQVRANIWQGTWPDVNHLDDGFFYTAPVGGFSPNDWGVHDMIGNVWEWTADWYAPDYYLNSPASNPSGPDSGDNRVARGGSWFCSPNYCGAYSTHYRGASPPDHAFNNVGFRCAADADYE
ncbi:MAG: formylglycine-generating enzyme family protein [Candidatus Zixiibacteriota bacterium]|nr:MAG: formylglycine-generating enzyme family protein [candidate division Zixibacteria bacterium]